MPALTHLPPASPPGPPEPAPLDVEALASNVARVIEQGGKALAAYLRPREQGEQKDINRVDDIADVVKTLGKVLEYWLSDPNRIAELQTRIGQSFLDLFETMSKRLAGEPAPTVAAPEMRDKRFADPEWSTNPYFDFLKQAYLLAAMWANTLVAEAKLDPAVRQKAEFYLKQIANALSPSNFILTNPELWRITLASNAENLVRGMTMLAEDIAAGNGELRIRQSDLSRFEVGRNLALAPGKVVYRNDLMELIQYTPTTEHVLKAPLLVIPPWINKYYILDLTPQKSLIKWCVDQGLTVFCISWVNPDARLAQKNFADYMREGPLEALDVMQKITGERRANAIAYCVGGTLLAATLAYLAAKNDDRVLSATLMAAQVDFTYAGDLKVFAADEEQIASLERRMNADGFLQGSSMANTFNMLRSNDLIWPYVVNNYLKGKPPTAFDLLYWNADATRMPAANHSFYLRNCYLKNNLSRGEMEVAGIKLDLRKIKTPIYNLATREDHIAPAKSVLLGTSLFGGPVKFVLTGSGHIAGVINPPAANKYQYWTGGKPADDDLDGWLAAATEHAGSWWPDWLDWLKQHGADMVPARQPGAGPLPALTDAPGDYVRVKS
jgi:polyhydroxyalkanoate synthase